VHTLAKGNIVAGMQHCHPETGYGRLQGGSRPMVLHAVQWPAPIVCRLEQQLSSFPVQSVTTVRTHRRGAAQVVAAKTKTTVVQPLQQSALPAALGQDTQAVPGQLSTQVWPRHDTCHISVPARLAALQDSVSLPSTMAVTGSDIPEDAAKRTASSGIASGIRLENVELDISAVPAER
jgi:hypothetical protein